MEFRPVDLLAFELLGGVHKGLQEREEDISVEVHYPQREDSWCVSAKDKSA